MQTPTLIIRLIGIYLALKSVMGFLAWREYKQLSHLMGAGLPDAMISMQRAAGPDITLILLMLFCGIFITWRAGSLARILTLDAERRS